jgi:hypothetical protein
MKRPLTSPVHKKGDWSCCDKLLLGEFPCLAQLLCDGWWDDGKPRELATISINFSQGSPTMAVHDHALQRSGYTTADTLREAAELLEAALAEGTLRWRPWKAGKGR